MSQHNGWIGVDLDGTLAEYESVPAELWDPFKIGKPIPKMVSRIKHWLADGIEVRIVTARVALDETRSLVAAHNHSVDCAKAIHLWLHLQGLPHLRVQAHKDYNMLELWDDRAVQVIKNTGERADGRPD